MKDDYNYIDELVKGSLEGLQEKAGKEVWERLRWTLFLMKYRWYIGLSSLLLLLSVSALMPYSGTIHKSPIQDGQDILDPGAQVLLVYNQEVESHALYGDEKSKQQYLANNEQIESGMKMDDYLQPAVVAEEIVSSENFPHEFSEVSDESSSQRRLLTLSGMAYQQNILDISADPDSGLIGFNRRTDLKVKEVNYHWFSLNIFVGPSFPESHISGMTSEYLDLRQSNESNGMGWSMGSNIRFHMKNWVLTTGLNYSVYNQNRTYLQQYQEYAAEDSYFNYDTSWVYIFDAPDYGVPMISGIDSTWIKVYRDVTVDNSGKNQVQYIEIPLMVGYRLHSDRLSLELNAGASMGFLVYSNFKVPSLTDYSEIEQVNQMNSTMLNFVANASLYYHLDRRTSLFVSPYYKQNLKSIFNDSYHQAQHFNTIGINFGVNISF